MRLRVFSETTQKESPIYLQLVEYQNDIALEVVDPITGLRVTGGTLLVIQCNGTIRRAAQVSKDIGLPLDKEGRLIVNKE